MRENKNNSTILLSIFKRKGGEGVLTKIINHDNSSYYHNQIASLNAEEKPLLCFKQDESNWLLITNNQIIEVKDGISLAILHSEIVEVGLAVQKEFQDEIMNKADFTRLSLKDRNGKKYIIKSEKGKPYQGIYQMLHHIASKNATSY